MSNLLLSFSSVLSFMFYIIIAICALLFMIMIHELGHYTAGKLLKFKIEEFSIGFGKAIYSKTKKNGEKFSLRVFPLGGYCAFEGEDKDNQSPTAFNNQKPWKRLIVLFMGAFFNFLSAIVFAVIFLMSYGYSDRVQVASISPYVANSENGFVVGDVIHSVNGQETNFIYDDCLFFDLISDFEVGEDFTVSVFRNGQNVDLNISKTLIPFSSKTDETYGKLYALDGQNYDYAVDDNGKVFNINSDDKTYTPDDDGKFVIGDSQFVFDGTDILAAKVGVITQNYCYSFFEAIGRSFVFCFGWAWKILIILWHLISGQIALSSLGGTVTTVVTIAQVTQTNIASLLLLIPLISINLAVFNLLPFPALDGARMVFVGIEWIFKKPINRKIEGYIHFGGLMFLLLFVLIVDILHFVL